MSLNSSIGKAPVEAAQKTISKYRVSERHISWIELAIGM